MAFNKRFLIIITISLGPIPYNNNWLICSGRGTPKGALS